MSYWDNGPFTRFLLLSGGTVFVEDTMGFFTRYWLTGCDMAAVDEQLWSLTGAPGRE